MTVVDLLLSIVIDSSYLKEDIDWGYLFSWDWRRMLVDNDG